MEPIDCGSLSKTEVVPHVSEMVKLVPPTSCSNAGTPVGVMLMITSPGLSPSPELRAQFRGGAPSSGAQYVMDAGAGAGRSYWFEFVGPDRISVQSDPLTASGSGKLGRYAG